MTNTTVPDAGITNAEQAKSHWGHSHQFLIDTKESEKKVNIVFAITTVMMVLEIVGGTWFGSMALLADGWHMFTHSAAFAVSMFVYWYSKKHKDNKAYSFGTGKVNTLGGFASAIALGTVALMMIVESTERLFVPQGIHFNEAIGVATVGLVVNVISAFLLHDDHHHHHHHHHGHAHHHDDHDHDHEHGHEHGHGHDHNLRAAYFHVLADTLTSVFAIVALFAGKYFGWVWADALMGIVGSVVVAKWAYHLLCDSSAILLDKTPGHGVKHKVEAGLAARSDITVTDIHVWKLSGEHLCAMVSVATASPVTPDDIKAMIAEKVTLHHITVEINPLQTTG